MGVTLTVYMEIAEPPYEDWDEVAMLRLGKDYKMQAWLSENAENGFPVVMSFWGRVRKEKDLAHGYQHCDFQTFLRYFDVQYNPNLLTTELSRYERLNYRVVKAMGETYHKEGLAVRLLFERR